MTPKNPQETIEKIQYDGRERSIKSLSWRKTLSMGGIKCRRRERWALKKKWKKKTPFFEKRKDQASGLANPKGGMLLKSAREEDL